MAQEDKPIMLRPYIVLCTPFVSSYQVHIGRNDPLTKKSRATRNLVVHGSTNPASFGRDNFCCACGGGGGGAVEGLIRLRAIHRRRLQPRVLR